MIAASVKILLFVILILIYICVSFIADVFIRNEFVKLRWFEKITTFSCTIALKILGIHVKVKNKPIDKKKLEKVLVVSNHLAYIDILIYASEFPSLFITSVEVQRMFFLGLLSKLGGSFFVERRSKTKLLREIDRIADIMKKGFTVTLFPEGTSSNGDTVLPFKGALFSAAEKADVSIQPACIRYTSINGAPVTEKNRDLAYYYGDIEFFPHLWKLFFVKRMTVTVTFLEPVVNGSVDRKELVSHVFSQITECYQKNEA
jgi:lyso-ornithine lipid O-acyltransferase